jgi:hypothetical protein
MVLAGKGYEIASTTFGYLPEFNIHVRGESMAKVWKTV